MSTLTRDMTSGSELEHIIRFSLPLLLGNLLQQFYNVADTIIVGQSLGDDAIAAIGATSSITYLFYTLCLGLAAGAGIIIAQYFGGKENDKVKLSIVSSAAITLFFGIIVSIASCFLAGPVLRFLGTPEELLPVSTGYMQITCGGTVAVAAYNWINAVLRALGDSKTPLIFLGFASVTNVGLDLLFVFPLGLGVNGAAWATLLTQCLAAILSILFAFLKNPLFKLSREHLHFDRQIARRCIKMGIPIAVQNAMISVSMVILQRVTNSFGETIMAAYTVSMRIEQFIQQPFSSLNVALSNFVGQNYGAGKLDRAVKGYHIAMKISAVLAIAVMLIFMFFARSILGWFVSSEEVIFVGDVALKMTCCFYLFLGTIHVTRGFLNGVGDANYAMLNGMVEVICRLLFAFLLTSIPLIGYWGIWGTTSITWIATAVFSVVRYKQRRWARLYERKQRA